MERYSKLKKMSCTSGNKDATQNSGRGSKENTRKTVDRRHRGEKIESGRERRKSCKQIRKTASQPKTASRARAASTHGRIEKTSTPSVGITTPPRASTASFPYPNREFSRLANHPNRRTGAKATTPDEANLGESHYSRLTPNLALASSRSRSKKIDPTISPEDDKVWHRKTQRAWPSCAQIR